VRTKLLRAAISGAPRAGEFRSRNACLMGKIAGFSPTSPAGTGALYREQAGKIGKKPAKQ
jgi:hypothetical protein